MVLSKKITEKAEWLVEMFKNVVDPDQNIQSAWAVRPNPGDIKHSPSAILLCRKEKEVSKQRRARETFSSALSKLKAKLKESPGKAKLVTKMSVLKKDARSVRGTPVSLGAFLRQILLVE